MFLNGLLTFTKHTMTQSQNVCAFSQVRKYFQTDEMPERELLCPFDGTPFGGIISFNGTLKEHIFQLGLSDRLS